MRRVNRAVSDSADRTRRVAKADKVDRAAAAEWVDLAVAVAVAAEWAASRRS